MPKLRTLWPFGYVVSTVPGNFHLFIGTCRGVEVDSPILSSSLEFAARDCFQDQMIWLGPGPPVWAAEGNSALAGPPASSSSSQKQTE